MLKEEVEVLQKTEVEKKEAEQKQRTEKERQETEIYKIYDGKNYTYNEWKIKEQELWEAYQQTKKKEIIMKVLRVKSVNGDTNFQNETVQISGYKKYFGIRSDVPR